MPFPEEAASFRIRSLVARDRGAIEEIVTGVGNFNEAEIACALELVDIYLGDPGQEDYRLVVAERSGRIAGYVCYGPTPLTRGTYDLYWIASHPDFQGRGVGRLLMSWVEDRLREEGGRLLVVETSSKSSYEKTVRFYQNLGYETASRIADFYEVGDDKLTFVKRLVR